jgi:hypothetical protein
MKSAPTGWPRLSASDVDAHHQRAVAAGAQRSSQRGLSLSLAGTIDTVERRAAPFASGNPSLNLTCGPWHKA